MTIGNRIKQARYMRGLSLRELARRVGLSAQAISKYERDLNVPSSRIMLRLAQALDVRVDFFLRPQQVIKIAPDYRKHSTLPRKQEKALIATVLDWLEKYIEVESLRCLDKVKFTPPANAPYMISSWDDVERAAVNLRESWQLGLDPIENLTELLEDKGIKVGLVDADNDFDACTFQAEVDGKIPVIVTRHGIPGDRQRFNLAHELGHLLLKLGNGFDIEKAMNRFAGAFLVPEPMARFELGDHRNILHLYELHLLKHKYGLSMQAWIYRAKDLGILSESKAMALFKQFKMKGWHTKEPGDSYPPEQPKRFERLVMQALVEDIISEKRAAELLGKPMRQFLAEVAKEHEGLPVGMRYG